MPKPVLLTVDDDPEVLRAIERDLRSRYADRYRIIALLGKGGMGEVYRADDLTLGQQVALKFLPESLMDNPDSLTRFRNEVRVARQVSHPNVCRVYDIGEVDGQSFISMEYVDGDPLERREIARLQQFGDGGQPVGSNRRQSGEESGISDRDRWDHHPRQALGSVTSAEANGISSLPQ